MHPAGEMMGLWLKLTLVILVLALILQRLFNHRQKKTIHFWVARIATGLVLASLLALLATWWRSHY